MDITTLIKEAKQGSKAAQKALFDMFADKMLLLCCRYVKRKEELKSCYWMAFISSLKICNHLPTREKRHCIAGLKE
jgi:hypothetical protein